MNTWIKKDLKYIWHPYTQMKDCKKFPPILIDRAEGSKLYDNKGNFYYDTISSWWCNIHGHNHPKIKKAIKEQLDRLEHVLFAGFTHKSAIKLSEALIKIAPKNLKKVFFSDNGSTAVETALKMSFQYWRNIGKNEKTKFVSLDYGYHGDTIGAMSVSGVDLFNKKFRPLFFSSYKAPSPYCYRCPKNKNRKNCKIDCVNELEKLFKRKHDKIAAFILEPMIMAAGGMIIYPGEYLEKAAYLAGKYNIHLIADEVATGFGRTGKMFACEHAGIKPDFMCLSKGITAGYMAFAATLTTEKIYKAFYADHDRKKTFYHGHTYTANPIACSAALASLSVFKDKNVLKNVEENSRILKEGLGKFTDLGIIGDMRSIGLTGALELVADKKSKRPFNPAKRIGLMIYKESLKRNLILRPLGDIIYLYLPLSIKRSEIQDILNRAYKILRNISKKA